ncbi:hypothetical protein [Sanguibacter suaedae]|uniref:Antitoxin Xre/MbcA/ParS-like toxin-binding domain-containing protein n=1 Tax=Sanguibacter suaedae TaxID=2795737 RepID=A0A934ID71_9MICO|nr:hypothetical protein [Sanguibacter suaedae]MBI9115671.1 hypothetical protein [Sanguibacter suaedae]
MTTREDYQQVLLAELTDQIADRLRSTDVSGLASPADVARQMMTQLPQAQPHPWAQQIGPFYDTAGVVAMIGSSKAAVSDRVHRGTLIGALTRNGTMVYPAFQFEGREMHPGIKSVLGAFKRSGLDGWAIASWFTVPAEDLDGQTPAQWIRDGHDITVARELALETVARWTAP